MTETTSSGTEHQETAPGGSGQSTAEKQLSQAEIDNLVESRLARQKRELLEQYADYDDLKAAKARLQEIEDAGKSEQQRLNEQLAEKDRLLAEREAALAQAQMSSLRATVAADKGVPAGSLTGSTKEELEASADQLIAWRDAAKPPTRKAPTSGGLKSGASSGGDSSADPKERAAAAVRAFRGGA